VIYPAFLRSNKKEIHNSVKIDSLNSSPETLNNIEKEMSDIEVPFIKFTVVQEISSKSNPIYKYIALRILSFTVEVDSSTIRLLYLDLLDDLTMVSRSQAIALTIPDHWIEEYNLDIFRPTKQQYLINIYETKIQAQSSKIYIKKLIIHPIKITLTLVQSVFPRRNKIDTLKSTVLNFVMALVGVECIKLKFKSFAVEDALESSSALLVLIINQVKEELYFQLPKILISFTMVGSPIGFARKVGRGVKAFFYEPYLGSVQGSQEFFIGLGKGTSSLFTGVVTGFMDSAVSIVGTAAKGISYLSGDEEYIRERSIIRQQIQSSRGGIYEGLKDGSESLVAGFTAGVTGLISKPLNEGSKSGLQGFIKGIGLGLVGAAVKPILGIADGITSVASGISYQVDPSKKFSHVRPQRALEPLNSDSNQLIIVSLNLDASFAQEFVIKRSKQYGYDDSFIRYIQLENKKDSIILSNVYVYWRRHNNLWGRMWANISHCIYLGQSVGVMLYSGGFDGSSELAIIDCGNTLIARQVYVHLAANSNKMGNPINVIPPDIVFKDLVIDLPISINLSQDAKKLGELDGYRFGTANHCKLKYITGSEHDVLKRAQYYIECGVKSWKELDAHIWQLLWEWSCIHSSICRCCVSLFINRSDNSIQISRVQMIIGRNVVIIGSDKTGYDTESRLIFPNGFVVVFISSFLQSTLEVGQINVNINTVAFSATIANTQRETFCESKGGFSTGFLEKTSVEKWSKYVVIII
jgi:hypothetical protein